MINQPLISVLCSSFNHERFVGYFIQSLINQTYKNWELIIIDDCSTDNNIKEIEKFLNDSRIHFSKMDYNSGSSIVTEKAFLQSKGEIIVDCASDDALFDNYFETIIDIFINNPDIGVIYNSLEIIDENNFPYAIWKKINKPKYQLLSELFYDQNVLFSTGMAVRRNEYKKILPMNFACIQHQDYKWHIQLLFNTECKILETPLVKYRIQRKESKSLGTLSLAAKNRVILEEEYLMNTFLEITDTELVKQIINNDSFDDFSIEEIPFILGMSILNSNNIYKKQWGYKTLLNFFSDKNNLDIIYKKYNFQFKDFLQISNQNFFIEPKESKKIILINKIKHFAKCILKFLHLYKEK